MSQYVVMYTKNNSLINEKYQKFSETNKDEITAFINKKVLAGFECTLYTRQIGYELDKQVKSIS